MQDLSRPGHTCCVNYIITLFRVGLMATSRAVRPIPNSISASRRNERNLFVPWPADTGILRAADLANA